MKNKDNGRVVILGRDFGIPPKLQQMVDKAVDIKRQMVANENRANGSTNTDGASNQFAADKNPKNS